MNVVHIFCLLRDLTNEITSNRRKERKARMDEWLVGMNEKNFFWVFVDRVGGTFIAHFILFYFCRSESRLVLLSCVCTYV